MRYRDQRFPSDTNLRVEHDATIHHAQLVNVSATGARLSRIGGLPTDASVALCYLHLRFPARVVWSSDRLTGLRFLMPLSGGNLDLLRRARCVGGSLGSNGSFRELG